MVHVAYEISADGTPYQTPWKSLKILHQSVHSCLNFQQNH